MTSFYAANPHYAPDDFSEDRARFERCEEQAGKLFAAATKPQKAARDRAMYDLRGLCAPRYDRARAAVEAAFAASTAEARDLCERTVRELMLTGEMTEALSYRWDDLTLIEAVGVAMLELEVA